MLCFHRAIKLTFRPLELRQLTLHCHTPIVRSLNSLRVHENALPISRYTTAPDGLQVALPFYPRSLNWPCLWTSGRCCDPFYRCPIRALLRSFRVVDIHLLHCIEFISTYDPSTIRCCGCGRRKTGLPQFSCGVARCWGPLNWRQVVLSAAVSIWATRCKSPTSLDAVRGVCAF